MSAEGPVAGPEESRGSRHRGREIALQVLYAIDLAETGRRDAEAARAGGGYDPAADSATSRSRGVEAGVAPARAAGALDAEEAPDPVTAATVAFDRVLDHFVVPRSAIAFGRELVAGVIGRGGALDEIIGQHARNWRVSRMAAVDRNVLRIAVYELRDTDTPVAVVIDEAVDLARRFGSDTSPGFVNGILDAVAREVRAA